MRNNKPKVKLTFDAPVSALSRWNPEIQAAEKESATVFNMYSYIGATWDGTGITPDKLAAFLDNANGKDVSININSAGGNFFDGLAMHTMLSEYDGNVAVKVVGLAASAASMIAMAGDTIAIAESGLLMIHNAWTCACGNKNDMQEAAAILDRFDESMAKLYTKRTGADAKEIREMMDEETWLDSAEAMAKGFADSILGEKDIVESKVENKYNAALRKLDVTLAQAGIPRSQRREMLAELKKNSSTPSAAEPITPSADALTEGLESLLTSIKSTQQT